MEDRDPPERKSVSSWEEGKEKERNKRARTEIGKRPRRDYYFLPLDFLPSASSIERTQRRPFRRGPAGLPAQTQSQGARHTTHVRKAIQNDVPFAPEPQTPLTHSVCDALDSSAESCHLRMFALVRHTVREQLREPAVSYRVCRCAEVIEIDRDDGAAGDGTWTGPGWNRNECVAPKKASGMVSCLVELGGSPIAVHSV